jgi:hypothetical protein
MSIQTIYSSAARTATPTAVVLNTRRAKALYVVIDVTAIADSPSVVPTVDGYDSPSDSWFNLITGAAITGTLDARCLRIGPGLTAAANLTVLDYVPDRVRVVMTHGDADSITYSVSAHLLD